MSYGFSRIQEGGRFVKLLLQWKLINAMVGSVLHIAVSVEEALEMLLQRARMEQLSGRRFYSSELHKGV